MTCSRKGRTLQPVFHLQDALLRNISPEEKGIFQKVAKEMRF
jgi:hypothetical protein